MASTELRAAAQQALEALEGVVEYDYHGNPLTETDAACNDAINALLSALAEPVQEPATLPGPGLVMCPACCAQFDPALNSVQPVQEPVAQRGAMFRTHPAVERQRSVEAAVRPACGVDPAAKAQPVQEPKPVAWRFEARHIDSAWAAAVTLKHPGPEGIYMRNVMPLYAHPPQRLPLTDEEIERLWYPSAVIAEPGKRRVAFGRAVERAHGIGGEG